jgi:hypothetical protein
MPRTSSIGEHPNDQSPHGDSSPSNGSESLFSMYIDRVIEEDSKMVESWKGDADGMLVFVSFQTSTTSRTSPFNLQIIDRSLLCCDRDFAISVYLRYSPELAKHVSFFISYISTSNLITNRIDPNLPTRPAQARPTKLCHSLRLH